MFTPRMTHTRRQQYRHRVRGAGYALSAAVISLFAVGAARSGQDALTVFALLLLVAALCWAAGRSQGLAERWRVGADSERAVQHALKELAGSGWVVRNGVRWPGGGDIDHLVRSPDGVGFAIEMKCAVRRLVVSPVQPGELEGRFLGPMAYPDPKGERDSSMPGKRWSAQASGLGCRGTRVIWRKLDCLNPNLQKT